MGVDKNAVRDAVSIVDIIQRYTGHTIYSKYGRMSTNCLSPAHQDQHPSMKIDTKKKTCYCFACNESYDMFRIVKEYTGLSDFNDICNRINEDFHLGLDIKKEKRDDYDFPLTISEIKEIDPQLVKAYIKNPILSSLGINPDPEKYQKETYREYDPVQKKYVNKERPVLDKKGNYIYEPVEFDGYDENGKYKETHYIIPTQKSFEPNGFLASTISVPTIFDLWKEDNKTAIAILLEKTRALIEIDEAIKKNNLDELREMFFSGQDISEEFFKITKDIEKRANERLEKYRIIESKLEKKEKQLNMEYGAVPRVKKESSDKTQKKEDKDEIVKENTEDLLASSSVKIPKIPKLPKKKGEEPIENVPKVPKMPKIPKAENTGFTKKSLSKKKEAIEIC